MKPSKKIDPNEIKVRRGIYGLDPRTKIIKDKKKEQDRMRARGKVRFDEERDSRYPFSGSILKEYALKTKKINSNTYEFVIGTNMSSKQAAKAIEEFVDSMLEGLSGKERNLADKDTLELKKQIIKWASQFNSPIDFDGKTFNVYLDPFDIFSMGELTGILEIKVKPTK